MRRRWEPGDHLLLRHVPFGRVVFALPTTLVAATEGELVLWTEPGTSCIYPAGTNPDRRLRHPEEWELEQRTWWGAGVLHRVQEGRAHSLMHFWNEDGSFAGWYVNLQATLRPTRRGFDTEDHALDVWIEPDGSWHWKDEDHLDQSVELGIFTGDEARAIRAEGERVLAEWPFPTGWEDWRPDPAWPIPELPEDWHVV